MSEYQFYEFKSIDKALTAKKSNAYDEAVQLLRELKELAVHKDRYGDFKEKMISIIQENKNLSGLRRRIISANLMNK